MGNGAYSAQPYSISEPEDEDRGTEEARNAATVRRYIDRVWNDGNLDAIDALITSDHRRHHAGRVQRGRDVLREVVRGARSENPGLRIDIEDLFAEQGKVAARVTVWSTEPVERVVATGIHIYRLDGGLIIESWQSFDESARRMPGPGGSRTYRAQADPGRALAVGQNSPFTIDVRFMGGLTERQEQAFATAAERWVRIIVGDLPSVEVEGEVIDDVLIFAKGAPLDRAGEMVAEGDPTFLRPPSAGNAAFLPAKGKIVLDLADLEQMEADGTLTDFITHEMGHVLGITKDIWVHKSLLEGADTSDPTFIGPKAQEAYGALLGTGPTPVPVENTGGPDVVDRHWRETVFQNELMTYRLDPGGNPLSRVTAGSLQDLGYVVNVDAAEHYGLLSGPPPDEVGLAGLLKQRGLDFCAAYCAGLTRPTSVLPEDSLR